MNTLTMATTIKPEKFTELYFENNSNFPFTIKQNQKKSFQFTIHNIEYQKYTYPYVVYLDENGKKIEIDKGQFTLSQDGYKTITETYTVSDPISRAQIVINLTSKKQQIFFWVNIVGIVTSTQNQSVNQITSIHIKPVAKSYGAWYWQPLLNKSLMWLGLDKLGHDIWGSSFPSKAIAKNTTTKKTTK
ncbi:MAG TPA: hypothetical protein VNW29_07225 [Candidatus Sulfotelmatobacter sp.]|nr:hypothetical protein [Candidatus Sulfotelmatobacter sp.]